MAARKRKSTESQAPRRVSRRLIQPSESPSTSEVTSSSTTRTHSTKSYLDKLPVEIVQEIFQYCREPCLIHTCSRLHKILPSYKHWTQCLAGMAIIALPSQNDEFAFGDSGDFEEEPLVTVANRHYALPGLHAPLADDTQEELQMEALNSNWFDQQLLEKTYLNIHVALIRLCFLEENRIELSEGQERKVRKMTSSIRTLNDVQDFRLRLPTNYGSMNFEVSRNNMRMLHRQSTLLCDCSMIRLNFIHDCVIKAPINSFKSHTLGLAIDAAPDSQRYREEDWGVPDLDLDCNFEVLQREIRSCIDTLCIADIKTRVSNAVALLGTWVKFEELITLDQVCFVNKRKPGVVDRDMICAATQGWDASCLQELLQDLKRQGHEGAEVISLKELEEMESSVPKDEQHEGIVTVLHGAVEHRKMVEEIWERRAQFEINYPECC